MNSYRNDYGEVCVYCHTPHGANLQIAAPLWNRTASTASYVTYDQLNTSTLSQEVSNPGPRSLACLSCHDGTLGVDSIVNMPGTGGYSTAQQTSQNDTFLNNSWTNPSGPDASVHMGMDNVTPGMGCLACHSPGSMVGAQATDFTLFALGTDLRDDHPVGITFPTSGEGFSPFNLPSGGTADLLFYDNDGDGRADTNEIRMYESGGGFEVECASCHDPHGVPSAGPGSTHFPTFLRADNANSNLCLTCHIR